MGRKFQKNVEDFVCENCGESVSGNGFTNHCPLCLWSKHVDINPGDRQHSCQGMLRPIGVEERNGNYVIIHKCSSCGEIRRNKACENDSFEEMLKLASKTI